MFFIYPSVHRRVTVFSAESVHLSVIWADIDDLVEIIAGGAARRG